MATLSNTTEKSIEIFGVDSCSVLELVMVSETISAGVPAPALDFATKKIDLNRELIHHPAATYFGRIKGDSMKDAGIDAGDLVVIDKSIQNYHDKIAVCYVDGGFTVKRIKLKNKECWLMPANEKYEPLKITSENDFHVWGVVTHVIKAV